MPYRRSQSQLPLPLEFPESQQKARAPPDADEGMRRMVQLLQSLKDDMGLLLRGQSHIIKGVEDIRGKSDIAAPGPAGVGAGAGGCGSANSMRYDLLTVPSPLKTQARAVTPQFADWPELLRQHSPAEPEPLLNGGGGGGGGGGAGGEGGGSATLGHIGPQGAWPRQISATSGAAFRPSLASAPDGMAAARGAAWWSEDPQRSHPLPVGDWQANIRMRQALEVSKNTLTRDAARARLAKAKGRKKLVHQDVSDNSSNRGIFRIYDPNSRIIAMWDFVSSGAFINDLLLTPYVVAWELSMNTLLFAMAFGAALYWTLAICLKCRTGYYHGGELMMRQSDILLHYARTELLLDVVVVLADWAALALSTEPILEEGNLRNFLRLSKLLRIIKLLRLVQVWRLIAKSLRARGCLSGSTVQTLAVRLLQVMLSTIVFTHIMCCAWYSIGLSGRSDTGLRWLQTFMMVYKGCDPDGLGDDVQYDDAFTYASSFHWTLAQITLGAMEITPTNSAERWFCVVLLLVGLLFNATIVSLISSQTMAYVQARQEYNTMMGTLSRFLDQNKVDTKLQVRVRRQVLERLASNRLPLIEEDVAALSVLSVDLKRQLLVRTREKYLLTHALFRTWAQTDAAAMRALCDPERGPLHFQSYKSQDIVFFAGQEAEGMRLAVQGQYRYFTDILTVGMEDGIKNSEVVTQGAWICEAALWSHWAHVGYLESNDSSQMLLLRVNTFLGIIQKFELVGYVTREYGRAFHDRVTTSGPPFSEYPTDLHVPYTEASDLVSQDVGLELLRRERNVKNGKVAEASDAAYNELLKEVDTEKCSIVQSSNGELERTVALVALRITRSLDSRIFVEVGTWKLGDEQVSPGCALPGKKRGRSELPSKVVEQLLAVNLQELKGKLELVPTRATSEAEVKESPRYGLKTRYLRSIIEVRLAEDFSFQDVASMMDPHRCTASSVTRRRSRGDSSASSQSSSYGSQGSNWIMARVSTKSIVRNLPSIRSTSQSVSRKIPSLRPTRRVDEDFTQQEVFLLEGQPKTYRLYAWLLPKTVEYLRSDEGAAECRAWISRLVLPTEATLVQRSVELSGSSPLEPFSGVPRQTILEEESSEVSEI